MISQIARGLLKIPVKSVAHVRKVANSRRDANRPNFPLTSPTAEDKQALPFVV